MKTTRMMKKRLKFLMILKIPKNDIKFTFFQIQINLSLHNVNVKIVCIYLIQVYFIVSDFNLKYVNKPFVIYLITNLKKNKKYIFLIIY